MNSNAWLPRDAWLLVSLPWRRRADLSHVIGAFDALNHDIIPRDELEQSLRRLGGAGFVKLGDRISVTREGRNLLRRGKGRGMIDFAQSMEPILMAAPVPSTLPEWRIPENAYEAAYHRYRRRMDRILRRRSPA